MAGTPFAVAKDLKLTMDGIGELFVREASLEETCEEIDITPAGTGFTETTGGNNSVVLTCMINVRKDGSPILFLNPGDVLENVKLSLDRAASLYWLFSEMFLCSVKPRGVVKSGVWEMEMRAVSNGYYERNF